MSHQSRLLHNLVARAFRGAELLPLPDRADLHEAASIALRRTDPPAADVAFEAAGLLRQAENRQLEFAALLRTADFKPFAPVTLPP
jgi:hypothetical protein